MTVNLSELEKKARAANEGDWERVNQDGKIGVRIDDAHSLYYDQDGSCYFCVRVMDYVAAANPATVLALIEQVRKLEAECGELDEAMSAVRAALGLSTDAEANAADHVQWLLMRLNALKGGEE